MEYTSGSRGARIVNGKPISVPMAKPSRKTKLMFWLARLILAIIMAALVVNAYYEYGGYTWPTF